MSEITSEGKRLVEAWTAAKQHMERLQSQINGASCDVNNTERALAKWLKPSDAKPGEKIAVWFGDALIQVEVADNNVTGPRGEAVAHRDDRVTIRLRGKETRV